MRTKVFAYNTHPSKLGRKHVRTYTQLLGRSTPCVCTTSTNSASSAVRWSMTVFQHIPCSWGAFRFIYTSVVTSSPATSFVPYFQHISCITNLVGITGIFTDLCLHPKEQTDAYSLPHYIVYWPFCTTLMFMKIDEANTNNIWSTCNKFCWLCTCLQSLAECSAVHRNMLINWEQ